MFVYIYILSNFAIEFSILLTIWKHLSTNVGLQ